MLEECLAVPLVGGAEPVEAPPGVALGSGLEVTVEGAPPTNGTAGHSSNTILGPNLSNKSETLLGLLVLFWQGILEFPKLGKYRRKDLF